MGGTKINRHTDDTEWGVEICSRECRDEVDSKEKEKEEEDDEEESADDE
jgi:hypothetical protein